MDRFAAYGPTLLRLTLGVMFLAHAALKVFVFTIPGTVGFFGSLGLPPIAAYLTILAEVGGGLALLAGFRVKLISLPLAAVLVGAAHFGHGAAGFGFSNAGGGWEYPAYWAVVMVAQALLGAGAWALDRK